MSNTVGTITIEMLANLASMVSDMGKASQESAKHAREVQKQWQESLSSIEESFRGVAELLGVGLSIAGLAEVAKQSLDTAEKVENMSKAFGFSTQTIQTMGYAAALVGGDLDGASAAMARLERSAEQAASGNVQAAAAFKAIGIDASQVAELLKDPDQLLQQVAQHMAGFADGSGKTAAAMQIFGRGAAELIPLLDELGANYDELSKRAENLGIVLSSQDQSALAASKESMNDLKEVVTGLGNQFTIALLPAINAIVEEFDALGSSTSVRDFFKDLGTDISQLVVVAGQLEPVIASWIPSLESSTGGMKSDFVSFIQTIKDWTVELANHFANNWELMKAAWALFVAEMRTEFNAGIAQIETDLAGLASFAAQVFRGLGQFGQADEFDALAGSLRQLGSSYQTVTADLTPYSNAIAANNEALRASIAENQRWADGVRLTASAVTIMTTGLDEFRASLVKGDIAGNLKKLADAENNIRDSAKEMIAAGADATKVNADADQAIKTLTASVKAADAAQVQYDANAKAHAATLKAWESDLQKLQSMQSEFASGLAGPELKALQNYDKQIELIAKSWDDAAKAGKLTADVEKMLSDLASDAGEKLEKENAALKDRFDIGDKLLQQLRDQGDALQYTGDQQKAMLEVDNLVNEAMRSGHDLYGNAIADENKRAEAIAAERGALQAQVEAELAHNAALKQAEEIQKQWQSITVSGFDSVGKSIADFATGGIKTWHDFGQSLLGDAKQFIAAIIQQFLKLTIFNGIINSLFGLSGSSALPTGLGNGILGSIFSGGSGGGIGSFGGSPSITGSIINDIGQSNLGGLLGEGNTVVGTANNAWNWLSGGGAAFDSTSGMYLMQSSDALGLVPDYAGTGIDFAGQGALTGTYGGEAASAGAGFSWFGAAGGALAGYNEFNAAGGGVGGLAGAAAYGVGTYFAGAAASAALSGGIAAGMAAIPVVGWIALAAMGLNMITGGGLFGTAAKPIGGEFTETVGAGGIDLTDVMHEKGKKALFGGSYYKDQNLPIDPAAVQAAQDFYNALVKGRDDFAKQFNVAMGDIVGGTFVQHFDKKGNPTTTDDTVLGVTYHEDQQHFAERLQADNFLAVLDKMGIGASAFVSGVQADADKLMAAVQDMAGATQQAQADIKKGMSLLTNDTSIADVMNEVIKLDGANESLANAYKRLQTEQQAFMTDMQEAQIATGKTAQQVLEFADAEAQAAGGAQALAQLIDQFNKIFYTSAQIAQNAIDTLKAKVAGEGAAIGENPAETLAQFFTDYQAALPTLSADQIVAWKQFGVDLANLYQAEGQAAQAAAQATANYQNFIDSFDTTRTVLSPFEQTMVALGNSIGVNVDKANALAQAAGLSGASMADLGKIITGSIAAGVAAVQQLEAEATQLSASLFGTSIDQLNQQLADAQAASKTFMQDTGMLDYVGMAKIKSLQGQIAEQEAQAQAMQQLAQASALLGDLGQIGAITGGSLKDLAAQFHIPLDKFAKMLGLDDKGLKEAFSHQEDLATAALATAGNTKEMKELLADINATLLGQPLPFSPSQVLDAENNPSGKQIGHGYIPPGGGNAQPASVAAGGVTEAQRVTAPDVVTAIREHTMATRELIAEIKGARKEGVIGNRNKRAA